MFEINNEAITINQVMDVILSGQKIKLSDEACARIQKCRDYLDQKMANHDDPIYGINTGFGSLHNTKISKDSLGKLQENLVKSHACGMGDEIRPELVKLMLFLKIQGLSYGHSGVQLQTVQRLVDFFNNDILPIVYELGSLGASGDLSPLAHLSLPLIGMGEVRIDGEKVDAAILQDKYGWNPIELKSKEGLALLNGTQFMSAFGVYNVYKAENLLKQINLIASMSLDAFDGRLEPFSDLPHLVRKQTGQLVVAREIRANIEGSEIAVQSKKHVQDPYSFRCIPQVHGATYDAIQYVKQVFETEINSVTDNPTIFPDEDQIISAGNFHGQPLAISMDFLAIALAELGSISERRIYKLVNGERGLPPFLVAKPGLNSGFMIPQYTAASVVSQNKQLCTPASVDTIDSSNGQEDHVSMGANAATKLNKVTDNVQKIAAIEAMCAAQALEFRRPLKSSDKVESFYNNYRKAVKPVVDDDIMYLNMKSSKEYLEIN